VTDANDHSPLIDVEALSSAEGRATTPEAAAVGSFVAHVIVRDRDAGANGRLSCRLDGHDSNLFRLQPVSSAVQVRRATRGVATGVYRYIYPHPQNQSTVQIFIWLLVVFRYRASVRLSKISKVEIYTPNETKFLATPLRATLRRAARRRYE